MIPCSKKVFVAEVVHGIRSQMIDGQLLILALGQKSFFILRIIGIIRCGGMGLALKGVRHSSTEGKGPNSGVYRMSRKNSKDRNI